MELGFAAFGDANWDPETGRRISEAQAIRNVVESAVLADQVGLDWFGIGEHHTPEFPASAGAPILAAIAAQTTRIKLSTAVNVLSTDDPVRVYEQYSTVDAISNGRVELIPGRGSSIESFPLFGYDLRDYDTLFAEKLELLLEINQNERVVWKGKTRPDLNGEYVPPRAEHGPIPIWVGSYKPRMLALTGAVGDGWLPSIEYIEGGLRGLADANTRIDDAAREAGRDPAAVRRLMNFMRASIAPAGQGFLDGPPQAWVDRLTMLALDHGVSAFLVGGDDPTTIARFGAEIAPAVRENVEHARQPAKTASQAS